MERRGISRWIAYLLFSAAGCSAWAVPGAAPAVPAELTTARRIHSLSAADANRSVPAHVHGVVTVLTDFGTSFFLQDATGGIYVLSTLTSPRLEQGMEVDVLGVAAPGQFAPVLNAQEVKVVGRKPMPPTRIYQWDELAGGKQYCNWVGIRGLVHSLAIRQLRGVPLLAMQVDIGSGNLVTAFFRDYPNSGWEKLRGAAVSMEGAAGAVFNDRRQFVALGLYITRLSDIHVEKPASGDPFSLPVRSLDSLLRYGDNRGTVEQVKLRGVVTFSSPGEGLYIQSGGSGAYIQAAQKTPVEPGSVIEAAGFPEAGDYSPILSDAVFRVIGKGQPVIPQRGDAGNTVGSDADAMPLAPFDALLVRMSGELVEVVAGAGQDELILRDGNKVFTARLPHSGAPPRLPTVGAQLELTGICRTQVNRSHEPRGFELLLRSSADIAVLKDVSWWSVRRSGWMVAVVLFVLLALQGGWTLWRRHGEMRVWAMTDPLTALCNRRAFFLLGEHKWLTTLRKQETLLLFFIDIDDFKQINDSFGHRAGDQVLLATAEILRSCFRGTDIIARMGGDEFAVACDAGPESQTLLEERLSAAVQEWNRQPGRRAELSLSYGVTVCGSSVAAYSLSELIARADHLMYEQKQQHKQTRKSRRTASSSGASPFSS